VSVNQHLKEEKIIFSIFNILINNKHTYILQAELHLSF